ncbi:MAG: META domain-containing protein [Sphingomonas bacterium]
MKIALALVAPALLLAGSAIAAPPEAPYRALGTEPGWTLTIHHGLIRYAGDYGRTRVTTTAPEPRPSFNGRRYVTPRITIDITRAPCNDGMSDREFPERVTVTVGRRTVRGCGGDPIVAPARVPVIDGKWLIETVAGHAIRGGRQASISFADGRISGNSGCNGFGGSYRFARGTLTAGPLISTKMACLGPVMIEEQAIFQLLGRPLSVSSNRNGKLVLSAGSVRTMVLVPAGRGFPERN